MIKKLVALYNTFMSLLVKDDYYLPEDITLVVFSEYNFDDVRNKKLIKVCRLFAELGAEIIFIDKTISPLECHDPYHTPINFSVLSKYEKIDYLSKKRTIYLYTHVDQVEEIKLQTRYMTAYIDVYSNELIKKAMIAKQVNVSLSENPNLIIQNYQFNIFTQLIRIDKDFCLKTLFLFDALLKNKL